MVLGWEKEEGGRKRGWEWEGRRRRGVGREVGSERA